MAAEVREQARAGVGGLVGFGGYKISLDNGWFSEPGGPRVDSFRYPGLARAVELCAGADALDAPVSIHAIGDLGAGEALDVFATMRNRHGTALKPHRLVHARRMSREDVLRCVALGVVVEPQPWEIVGAGRSLSRRSGPEFTELLSPYRTLLDAGATLAFSSDRRLGMRTDLADCDPLVAVQIAVTRRDPTAAEDERPFQPHQAIGVEEALHCATRGCAIAAGEAHRRGRIEPGFDADLVVLGADPTQVPAADAIAGVGVELTISAGRIVSRRPARAAAKAASRP